MGDRANIIVRSSYDADIYLYSHWGGYEMPETLRRALARKQRWDDPAYLRRIVFCEMVKGHEASETGFGMSTRPPDNEYPILVADVDRQKVTIENAPDECNIRGEPKSYSFTEYTALSEAQWSDLDPGRAP